MGCSTWWAVVKVIGGPVVIWSRMPRLVDGRWWGNGDEVVTIACPSFSIPSSLSFGAKTTRRQDRRRAQVLGRITKIHLPFAWPPLAQLYRLPRLVKHRPRAHVDRSLVATLMGWSSGHVSTPAT